jgi:hypothetical protein
MFEVDNIPVLLTAIVESRAITDSDDRIDAVGNDANSGIVVAESGSVVAENGSVVIGAPAVDNGTTAHSSDDADGSHRQFNPAAHTYILGMSVDQCKHFVRTRHVNVTSLNQNTSEI